MEKVYFIILFCPFAVCGGGKEGQTDGQTVSAIGRYIAYADVNYMYVIDFVPVTEWVFCIEVWF